MGNGKTATAIGDRIRTLFDAGVLGATSDRGLLHQFTGGGETSEAAFATLVERHGTMVQRVCRQHVADAHLAEDAFQATFLLLARRARSIHDPDALAAWLHRVARRVAVRTRDELYRRNRRERPAMGEISIEADDRVEQDELCAIVHEEIDRLSNAHRLPIVLCALEGLTHEEAAHRLRWPVGTVKSRLVRGRRRLESRLVRRGLAPSLTLVAGAAARPAVATPLALAVSTTRSALQVSAGAASPATASVAPLIAWLFQKELAAILLARMEFAALMVLVACASAVLLMTTLADPAGQHHPTNDPQPPRATTQEANVPQMEGPIVPRTAVARVLNTDPGQLVSLSANPNQVQEKPVVAAPERRRSALGNKVDRAINEAVRYLKGQQRDDGSWPEFDKQADTGTTSLVILALLEAGEKPDSPAVREALGYLRKFAPNQLRNTYAISLQTQVFAAADPKRDRLRILTNVEWLERAQIKPGERMVWPGSWTYSATKFQAGDNSNTQYALMGLKAAEEVGVAVDEKVWRLSREYFEKYQNRDGGWSYTPRHALSTASMTCAGISSLILCGSKTFKGAESLERDAIRDCGKGSYEPHLMRATDWLATHFHVDQNFGHGKVWNYYYLYELERAGRLSGVRFFGKYDWYREGMEKLLHDQNPLGGFSRGANQENEVIATSFALLFVARGREPILINKLYHPPVGDWNNDWDDIRNLVGIISRDWKHRLTWQVLEPSTATLPDLLQAPILFFNGHQALKFNAAAKKNLREYIHQGGSMLADACCGSADFDRGFRTLMKELFPDEPLRPLAADHPLWRARHLLDPADHPLWGIQHGVRTAVIYSPTDLSCYWNQSEHSPNSPAVIHAVKVGQNIIDYVTGRKLPPDRFTEPRILDIKAGVPRRSALRIARLKHAGDWDIAPQAVPNLMDALRLPPHTLNVVLTEKDVFPRDPNLIYYPLLVLHGRRQFTFSKDDLEALRRHLDPGGGTLFADAACGSPAFDATFRKLVTEMLPGQRLEPIPMNDDLFTKKAGFDLSQSQFSPAAGGGKGFPQLEGVKINGHWAIIYSRFGIQCVIQRHPELNCKGYAHESALKIFGNVLSYSTIP